VVKEKGQSPLVKEVVVILKDKEQGIHEEVSRPRVVEPYRPSIPFPHLLAQAQLESKFGKLLEVLK